MFGDIFDFDRDGVTDAFEEALGFHLVFEPDKEKDDEAEDLFDDEERDDLTEADDDEIPEDDFDDLEDL